MAPKYLMGLDAGSSGARCLLVDTTNGAITTATRKWRHRSVPDTGGWGHEFSVNDNWTLIGEAIREAMQRCGASASQLLAIATTSMRFGLVLLDSDGREIFAVPNLDARAAGEGITLALEHGPALSARTGHWPNPIFASARLKWLSENLPDIRTKGAHLLAINDWVSYRLCGKIGTDPSQAAATGLLDIRERQWAWDLMDQMVIPRSLFPRIHASTSQLGTLTSQAAQALELKKGTPIIIGGADSQCGLVGAGATTGGQLGLVAGTTATLLAVLDQPTVDPKGRMWTAPHVVPGLWVLESNAGAMGEALEWLARLLYPDGRNGTAQLLAEAATSSPGAAGILSTFGTTVMNAQDPALPVGNLAMSSFLAADDPHKRRHLARSVVEGMAFAVRANAEQILSVIKLELPPLLLTGGMSCSEFWAQLLADITGTLVTTTASPQASALGAAICAGTGIGLFADISGGASALVGSTRQYSPDNRYASMYFDTYSTWQRYRSACVSSDKTAAEHGLQAIARDAVQESSQIDTGFRPRILVTADIDERGLDAFKALGDVDYSSFRTEMRLLTGPDLVEALDGYHIFVTEVDVVDAAALERLPELKVIAACRGNAVNVDLRACTAFGIPVLYAPGRNADAVADLTLAFMLMLARRLVEANEFLRRPGGEAGDMARMGIAFQQLQGRELWERTVGLVGLGAVGRQVAKRLRPFGARVLVHDPFIQPHIATLHGAESVSLETLLQQSDFVSLHTSVNDETRGLVGTQELARMKPEAFLINTARAALVDEEALAEALRSARIGGAALDVFSIEPPGPDHPLLSFPNVIATPHVGGNTTEIGVHQGQIIAEDVERMMRRERPEHVMNAETLADFSWTGSRKTLSQEALAELQNAPAPTVSDLERKTSTEKKTVSSSAALSPNRAPQGKVPLQPPIKRALAGPPKDSVKNGSRLTHITGRLASFFSRRKENSNGAPSQPARDTRTTETGPTSSSTHSRSDSRQQMERILTEFVSRVKADPTLRAFGASHAVSTLYTLREPDMQFFIAFTKDGVEGALGELETVPDVRLKMRADVLDGMFTGRINAPRAAMTGKLSFSGDTRLAMGMQRVQKDLCRVYVEAREITGGPEAGAHETDEHDAGRHESGGHDTGAHKTSPPEGRAPQQDETSQRAIAPSSPPVSDPLKSEVIQAVNELYASGLITATGGNISVRIPSEDSVWITPGQLFKGNLRPEILVKVDMEGNTADPSAMSPSSERLMHCFVYRAREDVQAVIHAHAPNVTALGLCDLPFLPISTEAAFVRELPRVPFIMPGTKELADAVVGALGSGSAVLLQNHGLLVAASSMRRAADIVEIIERTSEVILRCHALGKQPPALPEEVLEELYELGRMMA